MRRTTIDKTTLSREISETLHIPLPITKKIVDQVFLKILKHMMHNRQVRIHRFGKFSAYYRKPRKLKNTFGDEKECTAAKFVPKVKFFPHVHELIEKSLAEIAEELKRRS
jgi:nucleoid DNA-binding protein